MSKEKSLTIIIVTVTKELPFKKLVDVIYFAMRIKTREAIIISTFRPAVVYLCVMGFKIGTRKY